MQRLTARILFLTALLGTFVPVALAIGAPAPHACCIRKSRSESTKTQIQGVDRSENCCPPKTPNLWATPVAAARTQCGALLLAANTTAQSQRPTSTYVVYKSVRAPPVPSIAQIKNR